MHMVREEKTKPLLFVPYLSVCVFPRLVHERHECKTFWCSMLVLFVPYGQLIFISAPLAVHPSKVARHLKVCMEKAR